MPTRDPMVIGPFSGGLNNFDDPTSVKDSEVVDVRNFDVGLDGSLVSRPPIVPGKFELVPDPNRYRFNIIGMFTSTTGTQYMIYSSQTTITYIMNMQNGNLTTITGLAATDMVQFDDKAWLLSGKGDQTGGWWNPSSGFTAVASMPKGLSIVTYKSRLFISNGISYPTRMYYSKVLGQSGFWDNPSYLEVNAGDGQRIVKLVSHYDSILVFRTNSIWEYQYTSDPNSATSYVMSPGVGLTNRFCLDVHESYIYFLFNGGLYELANNKANRINEKVVFKTDGAMQAAWSAATNKDVDTPVTVATFNNRILVFYYENIYVFHLRTRTWTTWRTSRDSSIRQLFARPRDDMEHIGYLVAANPWNKYFNIWEVLDETRTEDMVCSITTKTYSFESPGTFKVLFWWGIDALFNGKVRGYVNPVVFPESDDPDIETEVNSTGSKVERKFVKAVKKLRFRQISFRVEIETDGSPSRAPARLFSIAAYMMNKQTVPKQVS